MNNLYELLEKLKKYGISLSIKYYVSIDCFVLIFEKCNKSWAIHVTEEVFVNDLWLKSLENELDKLIESGYFNQP